MTEQNTATTETLATQVVGNPAITLDAEALPENRTLWGDVWRQYRNHRGAMVGTVVFFAIIFLVVFGSYIHDVDPQFLDIRNKNQGMSWAHPFGTDNLGRDMLAQVIAGGRVSLLVGVVAMALSLLLGALIGVIDSH